MQKVQDAPQKKVVSPCSTSLLSNGMVKVGQQGQLVWIGDSESSSKLHHRQPEVWEALPPEAAGLPCQTRSTRYPGRLTFLRSIEPASGLQERTEAVLNGQHGSIGVVCMCMYIHSIIDRTSDQTAVDGGAAHPVAPVAG